MTFAVKYNWDNAAPPELKCLVPIQYATLHSLQQEIEMEEVEPGVWFGEHGTQGLVKFQVWDSVENKMFSSRASYFNTEDGGIAIVECPIRHIGNVNWTLKKLQASIKAHGLDIRFFKVRVGQYVDRGEITYIPYEPHHENEVRAKLARQHGYYTVLETVS